nr:matrixin family metalloprotease [Bacteriovorax sp. HI3]
MRNLLFLSLFTLLFAACKKQTTTSQSALGSSGSACLIGKWSDSSLPLTLKMSSDFSGDITAGMMVGGLNPLEQMAKVWNDAVGGSKTLITVPFPITNNSGYSTTSAFRDSEIGIYKSPQWFSNVQTNVIAITQYYGVVTSSAGLGQYVQLTHADIIVNYRDYASDLVMANAMYQVDMDLPTVVLHEMGHLLGLCHESTKPSIMAPYYSTTQRTVQNFDRTRIQDIYINNYISGLSANSTNAISVPEGTEVKGMIELHKDGTCAHYENGKKVYEHHLDLSRKPDITMFKKHK